MLAFGLGMAGSEIIGVTTDVVAGLEVFAKNENELRGVRVVGRI